MTIATSGKQVLQLGRAASASRCDNSEAVELMSFTETYRVCPLLRNYTTIHTL